MTQYRRSLGMESHYHGVQRFGTLRASRARSSSWARGRSFTPVGRQVPGWVNPPWATSWRIGSAFAGGWSG